MKHGTILLIGNAHIDPVWLWQWPEGMHEVKATFRSALDRMNENPNFKFTASSSQFYAWVDECDPGMFKEIQARVAEARWELVGGWWVEPDCNIPCGESFVRQGLYGQRYLLEKFGRMATIGYNVDSFGHHAMLPQILRKMGLHEYVFMRPSDEEKALPTRAFLWQSADGSQVRAFRIFQAYNSTEDDLRPKVTSHIPLLDDECDVTMCFYGVGDHGGGPTKKSLASIARMQSEPGLPELRMAVVAEYFDRIGGQALPVIRGELQHHSRGCYSAHAAIKKANRKAEVGLLAAERLGVMARDLVGWRFPDLEKAWKTLLFNQFHDTLAGTAIEAACEDALHALGSCQTVAQEEAHKAIQAIASQIKVDEQECIRPIQVFNPCGWARNEPVELEFIQLPPNSLLLDDQGKPVPIQDVGSATVMDGKGRLCFMADLPAMGYRTYKFLLTEKPVTFDSFSASDTHIENQYLRVDIDPENGSLSIFDKQSARLALRNAGLGVIVKDESDTWSHNIARFDDLIGQFVVTNVKLVVNGPVKSMLRVTYAYRGSTLTQEIVLYREREWVDVTCIVDWREPHRLLKLHFPIELIEARATYEIPYGTQERAMDGDEEPGQGWLDISGLDPAGLPCGVSLLNDCKYSFSVQDGLIGLTALRSPIFAHHVPAVVDEHGDYTYMDQGRHTFRYGVVPHQGDWRAARVYLKAGVFNNPAYTLIGTYHPDGSLPQQGSWITVEPPNVMLTVAKQAEDGEDTILRLVEMDGRESQAKITLNQRERDITLKFIPYEIKTLRIPRNSQESWTELDLLENPITQAGPVRE